MEKLSSILAASPRVKSVDLSDAKPRRPGAPSFGAPMGSTSSVRDRVNISSQASEAMKDPGTYTNSAKDLRQAKMAENVTKNFFDNRLKVDDNVAARSEAIAKSVMDSLEETSDVEAPEASTNAPVPSKPAVE